MKVETTVWVPPKMDRVVLWSVPNPALPPHRDPSVNIANTRHATTRSAQPELCMRNIGGAAIAMENVKGNWFTFQSQVHRNAFKSISGRTLSVERKFLKIAIAMVAMITMAMDLRIITAEVRVLNVADASTMPGTKDSAIGEVQYCDLSTITSLRAI